MKWISWKKIGVGTLLGEIGRQWGTVRGSDRVLATEDFGQLYKFDINRHYRTSYSIFVLVPYEGHCTRNWATEMGAGCPQQEGWPS